MAAAERSLKARNAWLINSAIVAHLTVFAVLLSSPELLFTSDFASWMKKAQSMLAPGAVSLALVTIISLVLRGIVPSSWRDRIIHWRWKYPLPGSRAFSGIGSKDSRVDMAELEKKFAPLPTAIAEQNRKFYSIYTTYKDNLPVLDAHGSYLAARDLAMISAPMTVLLPCILYFVTQDVHLSLGYAACLLVAFISLCIAAQSYGRRVVENTLTLASQQSAARPRKSGSKAKKGPERES
jgi:hypothetical protein